MDSDFRNGAQYQLYRIASSTSQSPMYGHSVYPKVAAQPHASAARPSPYHHTAHPPPTSSSAGLGVRVAVKPEYRIPPPPHLSPQVGEISRSNIQFDFDFERKILAEAEKDSQNWSRLAMENLPSRTTEPTQSGHGGDSVVSKYIASGLSPEAVSLAVANYGDTPVKVREFVTGYALLREMGFSSSSVAEALVTYDNDTEKALAHFLNGSS
ncbi:uncharacterized protein LOC115744514 [Rhodamnia argentea]|uniref:Uncharacterized protein LOC115744514 n=1 Tax=Rhodamnia argentea TaxID=178133 RepID=A0A8B8PLB5_9MYRT|nr:uncharacterized protein LOC115744514 [Rhodamnia argentea]